MRGGEERGPLQLNNRNFFFDDITRLYSTAHHQSFCGFVARMPALTKIPGKHEINDNSFQGWNGGGSWTRRGKGGAVSNNKQGQDQGWRRP